jgi:hypothetical protein
MIVSGTLLGRIVLNIGVLTADIFHFHPEVLVIKHSKYVKTTSTVVQIHLLLSEYGMVSADECLAIETEAFTDGAKCLDADN